MNTDMQKELFDIFQNEKSNFEKHNKLITFIQKVEFNAKGEENIKFYEILVRLSNSINNAGHEERRSKDIDFINFEKQKIVDLYEKFLS
jgi:hypothetical protein